MNVLSILQTVRAICRRESKSEVVVGLSNENSGQERLRRQTSHSKANEVVARRATMAPV